MASRAGSAISWPERWVFETPNPSVGMVAFDHPIWRAVAGTAGAYLVLLAIMTVLLFLVPYLIFTTF